MNKLTLFTSILFVMLLAIATVSAQNDPGHDTLYIEEQGDSELNGTFNVTENQTIKGGELALDQFLIRSDGNLPGSNINYIVGSHDNWISMNSLGTGKTLRLQDQVANGLVQIGDTPTNLVDLNVSNDAYILGDLLAIDANFELRTDGTFPSSINSIVVNNTGASAKMWLTSQDIRLAQGTATGIVHIGHGGSDDVNLNVTGDLTVQGSTGTIGSGTICTTDNGLCASGGGGGAAGGWNDTGITVSLITATDTINASTLWVNNTAGRIGIGTTTPSNELEVAGDVELTNLYDNDATNFFDGTCTYGIESIDSTGLVTCAAQQGTGSGDVTDVLGGTAITVTDSGGPQPSVAVTNDGIGGDQLADTITLDAVLAINSQDVNFDVNTLFVDVSANSVGIGTATPFTGKDVRLDVASGGIASNDAVRYRQGSNFGTRDNASMSLDPSGRLINQNPFFLMDTTGDKGTTFPIGWNRYNNAGGGTLTAEVVSNSTVPNPAGKYMRVKYDGLGSTTPGYGGFQIPITNDASGAINAFGQYKQNTRIYYVIWAKIPVGRSIVGASNAMCDGYRPSDWLTPTAGTGEWEKYIRIGTVGEGGSCSSTGHFYISGGADVAFNWSVAAGYALAVDDNYPNVLPYANIGYKEDVQLDFGDFLTTSDTYLATDSGNVGIGTTSPTHKLHVVGDSNITGDLYLGGDLIGSGADLAEWFKAVPGVEQGDVVVMNGLGILEKSKVTGDTRVIGIVSTDPALLLGEEGEEKVLVALSGTTPVKATSENGAIIPGDLLITSSKPGHVAKCPNRNACSGAIVGKALEPLVSDNGVIRAIVVLG